MGNEWNEGDAFVCYSNRMVPIYEGDIIIRNAASFTEIMDALIEHAKTFLDGDYTNSKILDELYRSRFKNDKTFNMEKE